MSLQFTRIVADENIPKEVVEHLKTLGFKEVYWIAEKKSGILDPEVWRIATEKQAILITRDKGFLPQLSENQVLYGPDVVEYWAQGFSKDELRDASLLSFFLDWIFTKGHHMKQEHLKLSIAGQTSSRKELWGREKRRRRTAQ
jgi:hypothetical protein